jgi:D-alanyl-D-alanine carboxypeptidase
MQDQYSASWAGAAGGIVSSAADLLLFGRALDEGTLLDADDTAAMHETVDTHGAGYRYGLGLMELEGVDVPIYGHGGDIWGYHSALLRFPDSDATLVLLVNRDGADITPLIVELGEAAGLL